MVASGVRWSKYQKRWEEFRWDSQAYFSFCVTRSAVRVYVCIGQVLIFVFRVLSACSAILTHLQILFSSFSSYFDSLARSLSLLFFSFSFMQTRTHHSLPFPLTQSQCMFVFILFLFDMFHGTQTHPHTFVSLSPKREKQKKPTKRFSILAK